MECKVCQEKVKYSVLCESCAEVAKEGLLYDKLPQSLQETIRQRIEKRCYTYAKSEDSEAIWQELYDKIIDALRGKKLCENHKLDKIITVFSKNPEECVKWYVHRYTNHTFLGFRLKDAKKIVWNSPRVISASNLQNYNEGNSESSEIFDRLVNNSSRQKEEIPEAETSLEKQENFEAHQGFMILLRLQFSKPEDKKLILVMEEVDIDDLLKETETRIQWCHTGTAQLLNRRHDTDEWTQGDIQNISKRITGFAENLREEIEQEFRIHNEVRTIKDYLINVYRIAKRQNLHLVRSS